MFAGVRLLSSRVSFGAAAALTLIAADALAQAQMLQLMPQDTTININRSNYSTQPILMAYTWPDYTKANAILLKFDLSALNWLTPNVNDVPVALGAWHKIELYFKYNAPGTGVVRWWMDGTAIGDYSNV